MNRLDSVTAELKERPTREGVEDLARIASELGLMSEALPPRLILPIDTFDVRHRDLIRYLEELSTRPGFEWFDVSVVNQIDARWKLALRERGEPNQITELADDAGVAVARIKEIAEVSLQAADTIQKAHQAKEDASLILSAAMGFAQQAVAKRRLADAQKQVIEAETVQLSTQERLIDAASPFSEPFNYSTDYAARLCTNASETPPDEVKPDEATLDEAIPAQEPFVEDDPEQVGIETIEIEPGCGSAPAIAKESAAKAATIFAQPQPTVD